LFSRFLSPHLGQNIISVAGCCVVAARIDSGRGVACLAGAKLGT